MDGRDRRLRRGKGLVTLVCAVIGIALGSALALTIGHAPTASTVPLTAGTPIPALLTNQVAPSFTLVDQNGEQVSLASGRGHVTLVTFMDPVCTNLCPILGRDIAAMEQQLPTWVHPELLIVSTAPGRTKTDVDHFLTTNLSTQWLPGWHWLVGPNAASLSLAWVRWNVVMNPPTDVIGIVDASGRLRASFPAPLPVDYVVSTITRVART